MKRELLTDRQTDIAIAIREVVKTPDSEAWACFTDFTRAVATMLEGAEGLIHITEMDKRFKGAWQAYANMWAAEHNRIIRDCLGSQKEFDRVRSHPNGRAAIGRIMSRIREVHGEITPGMNVDVDVGDILIDELGETT